MEFLFTTTATPGSWLIRKLTHEPVSHVALRFDALVVQAGIGGITVTSYADFAKEHNIIFSVQHAGDIQSIAPYVGKGYDYGALLFLGVNYIAKSLGLSYSLKNLWNENNLYMCTEFATSDILSKDNNTITPYQLYLKLEGEQSNG